MKCNAATLRRAGDALGFLAGCCLLVFAASRATGADAPPDPATATRRGLALVTRAGSNWQRNQDCFSCHHQSLPMLAIVEAEPAGFRPDPEWIRLQADYSHTYFRKRTTAMLAGDHVPGGAVTVGYGLWALSLARRRPDDTTAAMVAYLLQIQGVVTKKDRDLTRPLGLEDGRWLTSCRRPPLTSSPIAATVLVLRGLEEYATAAQRPLVAEARSRAEKWLAQAALREQEDRVWRLWGLHYLGGDESAKAGIRKAILAVQRDDGGWGQTDTLQSDAYSTGTTLFVLCKSGLPVTDPAVVRARDYLLRTQHADGSWLVETRITRPVQPFFENGDPHGKHQFLSTSATAWATAALAQLLPKSASAAGAGGIPRAD